MFCGFDFLVGELNCRIVSIQINHRGENSRRYYDHDHFCSELQWIEEGTCDYICDKTGYHLRAGQLILIPPQMYHRETNASEDLKKLSILIEISARKKKINPFDACFYETFVPGKVKIVSVEGAEIEKILDRICSLANHAQMDGISKERLRVMCNSLCVELFAKISGDQVAENGKDTQNGFSQELFLDDFIAHQFMPGASFSMLAEQLHVSPRQLHRIITQKYGINYRNKIKEIRVEIATNFLCNTDKRISQIAELMGYSDTSSFSSFIKKATGKSPQQIRREGFTRQEPHE